MLLSKEDREAIKKAFRERALTVESIDPFTGISIDSVIREVHQHRSEGKPLVRITIKGGAAETFTEDHSIFRLHPGDGLIDEVEAGSLSAGDSLVVVNGEGVAVEVLIVAVESVGSQDFTYDLSVPGPENFVLSKSRILAHNSYSIGGISLDIDKSSKYQNLSESAESKFDKAVEMKARTTKITRGLRQPRFGVGIRSAFGPASARGVLSPRSYVS